MKKKAYFKNQMRIITKTKARFLSIFCIVFLGAAFFAGLRHSPLIMKESMHQYLQDYHWNDLNYIGTLGFDEDFVNEVSQIEGVAEVDYGFRFDGLMSYLDKANIGVTVYTDDDFKNGVDLAELISGRFPQKDDECVLDDRYLQSSGLKLKQEIEITNDYGTKTYTIVGTVNDTRYICNFERGTNSLGDGNNDAFVLILTKGNETMAVPDDLFELHDHQTFYNDLRIHLENPDDLYEFDDDYDEYVKPINKEVKAAFQAYYASLYDDLKDEANDKIADGQKQYDDGLAQYNSGMQAYQDGLVQYNDGKKQYEEGYRQYQDGLKQYNDGYQQYQNALLQYNEGYQQYLSGLDQYNQAKIQVEQGLENLGGYEAACQIKMNLEAMGQTESDNYLQIVALLNGYDALTPLQEELDASKKELDQAKATLDATNEKLVASKAVLDETEIQLKKAKSELDQAKSQLDESFIILNDAKVELNQAAMDLEDAKQQIDDLVKGKAVALTKNESVAILSFAGNCDSINALSILFPTIFFLVAALVSMTTMTRMVEELRTQNGTFRALGYKKRDVILQYLIYAFLATFFASCLGIVFGTYFFPNVIYYLYRTMMFDVGAPTKVVFETMTCIQTYLISVAVILVVTFMVCYKELSEVPAQILRPKAPKLGKRILLERIDLLWKRLSFNQKVTMRNIFRYKKRFFMSIIGIAGCAALIVVGFGIKGSVSPLAKIQYGSMWTYDGIVNYPDDLSSQEELEVKEEFKQHKGIASTMGIYSKMITVQNQAANIEIPSDKDQFSQFIYMEDYETGEELSLTDDGVYINAKLSELLDVKVGDMMTIELDNKEYDVKIAGIYKLYFRHYIYLSQDYYEKITNEKLDYNSEYFVLDDDANEDEITEFCDNNDRISSISFVSGIAEAFVKQMESLNSVVVILIVSAGALAFIVLYNLTNINIQERKSEIATIKVLGFYPKEVYDYVFRENIILAFIGSILGLGLGKVIHAYLIRTVEVDMAMFIRDVAYTSYLYAIVLTMIFTFLIDLFMRKVLRKIDMVESLKSIE